MTDEQTPAEGLAGRPLDDAVATVTDRTRGVDEAAIREALSRVTDDGGVVSRDGAIAAVEDAAETVAAAADEVDRAAAAVEDATAAAADYDDLGAVRIRLAGLRERSAGLSDDLDALRGDLADARAAAGDEDAALPEVGRRLADVTDRAAGLEETADQLVSDAAAFEIWLEEPPTRRGELATDLQAIGEAIDELADAVTMLRDRAGDGPADSQADGRDGPADGRAGASADASSAAEPGPAARWFGATVRRRLLAVQLRDVRAELADLEQLAERRGDGDEGSRTALRNRANRLEERLATAAEELDAVRRAAWAEAYSDELAAAESALAGHEPPVDWAAVERSLTAAGVGRRA